MTYRPLIAPLLCLLCLCMGMSASAQSQDEGCYELNEATVFCGRDAGWKPAPVSKQPGVFAFLNQEYSFTVSVHGAHGLGLSEELYYQLIQVVLQGFDARMNQPFGTHQPEFVEVILRNGIQGRRLAVATYVDDTPSLFLVDILYSDRNGWILETGHLGPITPERIARVHDLSLQELTLDP